MQMQTINQRLLQKSMLVILKIGKQAYPSVLKTSVAFNIYCIKLIITTVQLDQTRKTLLSLASTA